MEEKRRNSKDLVEDLMGFVVQLKNDFELEQKATIHLKNEISSLKQQFEIHSQLKKRLPSLSQRFEREQKEESKKVEEERRRAEERNKSKQTKPVEWNQEEELREDYGKEELSRRLERLKSEKKVLEENLGNFQRTLQLILQKKKENDAKKKEEGEGEECKEFKDLLEDLQKEKERNFKLSQENQQLKTKVDKLLYALLFLHNNLSHDNNDL